MIKFKNNIDKYWCMEKIFLVIGSIENFVIWVVLINLVFYILEYKN